MSKNSLRHAANLAKERMKNGYWKEARDANCARLSQDPQTVFFTRPNDDDPVFRAKVRYILESEEQILNPIRLLVEGDAFDRADCAKRQKMIFETSEKFRRIKEEIERERERAES